MKKMQMFFAILAVVFATAGVFGAELVLPTTVYYQSTSAGASCVTELIGDNPCPDGDVTQCFIDKPAPTPDVYISQRVDGGTCTVVMRN